MGDLKSPGPIYLKGCLFLAILAASSGILLLEAGSWRSAALLALAVWSGARLYYFVFYVIGNYVDPEYKFSGLFSFLRYLVRGGRGR